MDEWSQMDTFRQSHGMIGRQSHRVIHESQLWLSRNRPRLSALTGKTRLVHSGVCHCYKRLFAPPLHWSYAIAPPIELIYSPSYLLKAALGFVCALRLSQQSINCHNAAESFGPHLHHHLFIVRISTSLFHIAFILGEPIFEIDTHNVEQAHLCGDAPACVLYGLW